MLGRVSVRIGFAFAIVGLATMLAVGAGLFVTLRELHRDATRAAMADIAQPLVARIRLVAVPPICGPASSSCATSSPRRWRSWSWRRTDGRSARPQAGRRRQHRIDPAVAPGEVVGR